MNIELSDVSVTRKTLVVTLDAAEVAAEHRTVVAEFAKHARLPGFRPGKAPAELITRKYHKEISGEFKQKAFSKAYSDALKQTKLDVLNVVDANDVTPLADQPVTYTITVDVVPQFELPEYFGLPTAVTSDQPTEAEVTAAIDKLRGERADFTVVERAAERGDYVKLAYEGTVDGQPILEIAPDKQIYGKVPQTWEEVEGENEGLIPGLGKQLLGVTAGTKKEITITFPADFAAVPALAGRIAVYQVDMLEIRARVLPPLDEAFFKLQKVDDLAALQTKISDDLKLRKKYDNDNAQRRQISEALSARVSFEVPESSVESETQSVLRRFIEENMRRGVPADQFEKDKEQLYANAKQVAGDRVKVQMILSRIATKENLKVEPSDMNNYIYRASMANQQKPEKLVKELTQDREKLRAVQQAIIFDKTLDLLVSRASVSEVSAGA